MAGCVKSVAISKIIDGPIVDEAPRACVCVYMCVCVHVCVLVLDGGGGYLPQQLGEYFADQAKWGVFTEVGQGVVH